MTSVGARLPRPYRGWIQMHTYDPQKHHRRSVRLTGYDYAQPGVYFVTICVRDRECTLGNVVDGRARTTEYGRVAHDFWVQVPIHFVNVSIDTFVVMPNHVHTIIAIGDPPHRRGGVTPPLRTAASPQPGVGTTPLRTGSAPQPGAGTTPPQTVSAPQRGAGTTPLRTAASPQPGVGTTPLRRPTLGQIVAYYKYQTTKLINQIRGNPGTPFWQRSFYDHIIRNDRELNAIRQYIADNPLKWELDQDNPMNIRIARKRCGPQSNPCLREESVCEQEVL